MFPDDLQPDLGAISEVLFGPEAIAARVAELAAELNERLDGEDVLVMPVLTGAFVFAADLVRRLKAQMFIEPIAVRSYQGRRPREEGPDFIFPPLSDVTGRRVLLIDDIYDSGATLAMLQGWLAEAGAKDVMTCVLLRKDRPDLPERPGRADYVGFDVPNAFVVGYGLDLDGRYRNLPAIGVLAGEDGP